MDEQERLMKVARPGEVHSFERDADGAPTLGARLRLHPLRRKAPDGTESLDVVEDPDGPWRVVAVKAVDRDPARVTVIVSRLR